MNKGLDPSDSYAYQVRGVHRLFARILEKQIGNSGIKAGDWYLLRVLWEQDGISQKELSRRSFLTESSVVTMLNSMTKAGLVVRERDEHDRRYMKIQLTDKARQLKDELIPLAKDINANATRGVGSEELKIFMQVLSMMKDNLHEELSVSGPKQGK
jgi:DNA-binding MarR family transcriptional regulator